MQTVKIEISATREKEDQTARIMLEQKKGDIWTREESHDVATGMKDSTRTFVLQAGDRLVIEPVVEDNRVYDPRQMAVVTAATAEEKRDAQMARPVDVPPESKNIQPPADTVKPTSQAQLQRDQTSPTQHTKTDAPTPAPAGDKPQQGKDVGPKKDGPGFSTSTSGMRDSKSVKGD